MRWFTTWGLSVFSESVNFGWSVSNISPHTKFHPNRIKNTEVENFHYWSVLVGRAGWSQNDCSHFKLILCCFLSNISPHTKFHSNCMKNAEVENFRYWSVLVGRSGRSKNGRSHFRHSVSIKRPNLNQIG